jgi:Beta protein
LARSTVRRHQSEGKVLANSKNQIAYAPILKWKLGEQSAVQPLSTKQKASVLPIAELQDRPFDWAKDKYTKTWDKHIRDVVKATVKHWGTKHEIAFDQPLSPADELAEPAGTVWEFLFAELWAANVQAVPVISSYAGTNEIAALIAASTAAKRERWLLRYVVDVDNPTPAPADVARWFISTAARINAAPSEVDAVLDVAFVTDANLAAQAKRNAVILQAIFSANTWRNVVLAAGAFPVNLAGVPQGTHQIPRTDWALFLTTRLDSVLKGENLVYSDYCISHVTAFEEDPRLLKMSANLRYTHWEKWFIIKGKSVKDFGFGQYRDICKVLVLLPIYLKAAFSQGDQNYSDIAADPANGPGNATHWRRDATNHHIHVVLHQVASLPAT